MIPANQCILGIESSCDETAAAVLGADGQVLASVIASQVNTHASYGGIVPEIAAREHTAVIDAVVAEALRQSQTRWSHVQAIAVTTGPGLMGSLLVGTAYAKGLCAATGIPLMAVDHIEAHVHGALLGLAPPIDALFPGLALVVSGGHTLLFYLPHALEFRLLGTTLDDACGECFDKVAKLVGLGYPGGPAVEREARTGDRNRVPMPRMMNDTSLNFSYSGLKTHVSYALRKNPELATTQRADLLAAFQFEALDQLVRKSNLAAERLRAGGCVVRSLLVAGGVAANAVLRRLCDERLNTRAVFPAPDLCADNAAMVARLAWARWMESADERAAGCDLEAALTYPRFSYSFWDIPTSLGSPQAPERRSRGQE